MPPSGADPGPGRRAASPAGESADWQVVDRIFCAALDLDSAQRLDYLNSACGGDDALVKRVQHLLDAERDSAGAFEVAATTRNRLLAEVLGSAADDNVVGLRAGERLGAWRIERLLGGGGMAVVYLVERAEGDWRQQAALKLLRRGVETREDVLRFVTERQILSRLQHPNIARLLDGGTTPDGLPYLVAEFVDGEPLADHCDRRGLGVEARLDLFLQVADAVHYAHQQLVVHRDLKPANVIVDRDGRVRLLDFGIAKLLEPDPGLPVTRTGLLPMTPEYAAPEQLQGGPVTTATDVYQLGVLLHELLTGERPGVRSRPPGRSPSATVRLHGDLDAIVRQALREEPENRYTSAAALAADLRNHLRGHAIAARPERVADVARRFARRNPLGASAAATALLLLVAWLVSVQFYARELAVQRDTAVREAERATRVKALLVDVFRRTDPIEVDAVGGRAVTVWDSLAAAERRTRVELADEPAILEELQATLAALYEKAGRPADARRLLTEVLEEQEQRGLEARAAVAVTLAELGRIESALGDGEAASRRMQQALAIVATLGPDDSDAAISVLLDAGHGEVEFGSPRRALEHFDKVRGLLDGSGGVDANATVEMHFGAGNALRALGRLEDAERAITAALGAAEKAYGRSHARLAGVLSALGGLERELGRPREAAQSHRRALEILVENYGETYPGTLAARNNLALAYGAAGDYRAEQEQLQSLLLVRRNVLGDDHADVGYTLQNLGASLVKSGRYADALPILAEARGVLGRALPPGHYRQAFPLLTEAHAQLALGHGVAAETAAAPAVAILDNALPSGHYAAAIGRCLLGESLLMQGRAEEARALVEQSLPAVEAAGEQQAQYLERCRAAQKRLASDPGNGAA